MSQLLCVATGSDCDPRCPGCILRAGGVWDSVGDRHWVFPGDPDYDTIRIRQGGSWREHNPVV